MILLNTTFYVAERRVPEVLRILRTAYIPALLGAGQFRNPRLAEIIVEVGEGIRAFCFQVEADDPMQAMQWHDNEGAHLRVTLFGPYGEEVLPFTTPMQPLSLTEGESL